jgi:uncharacterized caspase-like protein
MILTKYWLVSNEILYKLNKSIMKAFSWIISFFLFLHASQIAGQYENKNIALIIGNSDYQFAGQLKFSAAQADILADSLFKFGFDVIRCIDCSYDIMGKIIEKFLYDMDKYETSLLYYSGHSVNSEGNNYIIPVDADISSNLEIENKLFNFKPLIEKMGNANLKNNLVLYDGYRSNKFCRIPHIWPGFVSFPLPEDFLMIYSAVPTSLACDCYAVDGLFASVLLQHFNDNKIEVSGMFRSVRRDIMVTSNKQKSFLLNNLKGEYYFVRNY